MILQQPGSPAAQSQSEDPSDLLHVTLPVHSWEPMLCSEAEDGQAPLSLELLYHGAQTTSPSDALVVAGHLLMLETGFTPQVTAACPSQASAERPPQVA